MSLGDKIFSGFAWSAVERLSVQAAQFVLGIILARILTPEEYGVIGILLVFIAVSNVFIDSGFTKALIQKKDRSAEDISTVFFFNIAIGLLCYLILWVIAPWIALFYEIILLKDLLRVLALILVINALFAVPTTLFTIDLNFKILTKINLICTILSGLIAIYMAYDGFGVWALATQSIIRSSLTAILILIFSKWKPVWVFSKTSFKELWRYGSNLLVSSLLNVGVNNFYSLFIAKIFTTEDLGFYTRGAQFTNMASSVINSILDSVILPSLTSVQDELSKLTYYTRIILKSASILIIPAFLLLLVIAEPLIRFLLTDKWLPAVVIMQIFCLARIISIICGINNNLLYVLGRTDLALKQQYIKIAIRVVLLIIALPYGIVYIAFAELLATFIHFFINTYHPGRIMGYGALAQLRDMFPLLIASVLMASLVFFVGKLIESDLLTLVISPIIAVFSYYIILRLFKIQDLDFLLARSKSFLNKKN